MGKNICCLFLFLLAFFPATGSVSAASVEFDSRGNLMSSDAGSSEFITRRASKFTVPEGVRLQKDIIYEYYPVFGKTFSEIVRSVEENGPLSRTGNTRSKTKLEWGLGLSYQFDYSYGVDEDENKVHAAVDILDTDINYRIKITLPTLLDDTPLNPIEKKLWAAYLQLLLENEHERAGIIRDINLRNKALEAIKEISYFIFDYKGDAAVENTINASLKDDAVKIGRELIKKINERLNDYDRKTEKGGKADMPERFFTRQPEQSPD